jgi:16S rRNA (guanine527-N7)-methyltransferase
MQLYPLAQPVWRHWADLGSGGGFPGIVIAIQAQQDRPTSRMTLVESDQRKATFLRAVIRELGLNAKVLSDRAESLAPLQADVLTARALGPLTLLLPLAQRHLALHGRALLPKGRSFEKEIDDARGDWLFDLVAKPSLTDPQSQILQIERIAHA